MLGIIFKNLESVFIYETACKSLSHNGRLLLKQVRDPISPECSTNTTPTLLTCENCNRFRACTLHCTTLTSSARLSPQCIYIRTVSSYRLFSSLLNWFKLVFGPFGQSIMHPTLNLCPDQPGRNLMYQS